MRSVRGGERVTQKSPARFPPGLAAQSFQVTLSCMSRVTKSSRIFRLRNFCLLTSPGDLKNYAKLMHQAKEQKRITNVPHEPSLPVWTAWDLGIADATAIWFAQVVGRELQKRDYLYAGHFVPHDAQAKELGTGKNRIYREDQFCSTIGCSPP